MNKSLNTIIYILSLFIRMIVFPLIIKFKDFQRIEFISGFLLPIGFILNIFSFTTRKKNS